MAAAPDGQPPAAGPAVAYGGGEAGSPGIDVNDCFDVRRERAHVFDFLSDGERLPAWMAGVKRARRTSGPGPVGPGTTYRIVGVALGRRVESRYQLTAYEPPDTFSSRMESRFFSLEQTYRFEDSGELTKVTLTGKAIPLGRFKLLGPFLFLATQRQVRSDHRKLKNVLERTRGRPSSASLRSSVRRARTRGPDQVSSS